MKSAEIQEQINSLDLAIQQGSTDAQLNLWEMKRKELQEQLQVALAEESQQQNLQERVEQAKETGYILDTIEIDGLPAIAFSHTPENHELLAIAVQKWALEQQDAFNKTINNMEYELTQEIILNNDLKGDIEKLERDKSQLTLDLKHAELSRDNAAKIIVEKDEEIKRLQENQTNIEAIPVLALSEEEKEKNLMVEVMGKQIKVVNVVAINPDSFTNKMFQGTNAVTGAVVEDYYIYLSQLGENKPKRYEEVSEETAEQLRTEYANKKALVDSIPVTQEESVTPVNPVLTKDEAAEKIPFQVPTGNGEGDTEAVRDTNMEQVVEESSEVITLESLQAQVNAIKAHVGLAA